MLTENTVQAELQNTAKIKGTINTRGLTETRIAERIVIKLAACMCWPTKPKQLICFSPKFKRGSLWIICKNSIKTSSQSIAIKGLSKLFQSEKL